MMNILLTNDDGVYAPGLRALKDALSLVANVIIVAPAVERSATGHTLSLDQSLRLTEIEKDIFKCDGFPADCAYLGLLHVFKAKGQKVDLVISGINSGANLGQDTYYSGTVAAAREAIFHGVPALAVSSTLNLGPHKGDGNNYYSTAANYIKKLVVANIAQNIPSMTLLNINIPWGSEASLKGVSVTKTGYRNYSKEIDERVDTRGKNYYWIGGIYEGFEDIPGSDCEAVDKGLISVSPLNLWNYGPPIEDLIDRMRLFLDEKST